MNTIKNVLVLLLSLLILGCVSAKYTPPIVDNSHENYSRTINKSFDDTWKALIQHSASTFFGIENFEKESGLITLSFGASNPSDFITGGHWKVADCKKSQKSDLK